jgi:two-component system response regulator AtoC
MSATENKANLLIVDDEKHTRDGLRRALEDHFEVYVASDLKSAVNILEAQGIDLVLTDLRLGADDGMELLERCKAMSRPPVCFMMTAYGSVDTAIEAMRRGAQDYVTKPVNIDRLELMLLKALKSRKVEQENVVLREELDRKFGLEKLIGNAPGMVRIFDVIRQVASSRATVLIEGESGTGKELAAHAIHALSPRKNRPFVAVHCAALNPQLLESELFGHEKGAFTGAQERRIGRFEQANGGTIFLDEIGEIDPALQVKLLRVLGERNFERVGGNQKIEVDVRLVAATNKSLEALAKEGKFREDLFYRLNVVRIVMPPLRDRREDIPLLVGAFLEDLCRENGKPRMQFDEEAMRVLLNHLWPGNVRELRAAVEHGVVLARGEGIGLKDLPPELRRQAGPAGEEIPQTFHLQEMEKHLIVKAIKHCDGNKTEAARLLGLSRRTLHRKLNEYGLEF